MKRKLLLLTAALLCTVGTWADGYTDYLNTANGYEEVTSTSQLADANYYYVFASAENTSLIIGITDKSDGLPDWYSGTAKILCYKSLSSDPISDATNFFIIQNNSGYEMFNVGYNSNTKFQTHDGKAFLWVNTGETNSNDYTKFIPYYDGTNGYWTFQNNKYPDAERSDGTYYGYLGPWTAGYVAANEHIAGNRTNAENDLAGHFKIYRIKRTRYAKDYAKLNPDVTSTYISNPGFESCSAITGNQTTGTSKDYASNGWTVSNTTTSNSCAAVVEYGSNYTLNSVKAPSKDNANNSGKALGMSIGWDITLTYKTANITLPAGHYRLSIWGYNSNTSGSNFPSKFGFFVSDSEKYLSTKTSFTSSKWEEDVVEFDLTSEKTGYIQVGATAAHSTSTSHAKVFLDNLTLTYSLLADDDDYTELTNAINAVESISDFGFDAGDYAPYNVLPILTEANAINQSGNNAYTYIRSTIEALNAITPNAAEVNAIAYGDLSSYETVDGKDYPWGWSRTSGSRIMGGSEGSNNTGLSASSTGKAMLEKYDAKYGEAANYKMPLKANTFYTLSFKYCGWGNTPVTNVIVKDGSGTALTLNETSFTPATSDGNSNAEHWYNFTTTFRTNAAGNYTVEFSKEDKTQQQIAWADMTLVRATDASEVKYFLNTEITAASDARKSDNEGDGVFQIPTAAGTTFGNAIATAQGVYDNASATVSDVVTAIDNLKAAENTYSGTTLNDPDSEKRYKLILANRGALTYKTGSSEGGYDQPFTIEGAYMAQSFFLTKVSGNIYKLSFKDFEGNTRYVCTRAQYGEGGTGTAGIRTTTEVAKALNIKVVPTSTANVFNMQNTERDNALLGATNNGDFYTDGTNSNWSIAEASQASVTVKANDGQFGTVIFPFTPDVSSGFDGITFYICESVNTTTNKVVLGEVNVPAANTPYLIKNTSGENFSKVLTGWGTASAASYKVGLLTGVYTNAAIAHDANNYILQTQDGNQAFYLVKDADFNATANKAYLTYSSSGVKAFGFEFGGTDAVNAVEAVQDENAVIYNLAGQRVGKAQKGLYIVNGKKVMVK